jgi:hypothetical protein
VGDEFPALLVRVVGRLYLPAVDHVDGALDAHRGDPGGRPDHREDVPDGFAAAHPAVAEAVAAPEDDVDYRHRRPVEREGELPGRAGAASCPISSKSVRR